VSTPFKDKQCDIEQSECVLTEKVAQEFLTKDTKDIWTDSGASRHIIYRREWLTDFKPIDGDIVSLGDDGQREVKGEGTVHIEKLIDEQWIKTCINNVPTLRKNLF